MARALTPALDPQIRRWRSDTPGCERSQEAVKRGSVGPRGTRQLLRGPGSVREVVRDAELGGGVDDHRDVVAAGHVDDLDVRRRGGGLGGEGVGHGDLRGDKW